MMNNIALLESYYRRFMEDIHTWLPDGMIEVDLDTLHQLDLLHFHETPSVDSSLTRYFHVVESPDKLTLVNEQFVVWIVPEKEEETSVTYTLVALNKEKDIQLELAFATRGVYNHSQLVLRLLEKYLLDIETTEAQLARLQT
jgi:hypothetical protein